MDNNFFDELNNKVTENPKDVIPETTAETPEVTSEPSPPPVEAIYSETILKPKKEKVLSKAVES